MCFFLFWDVAVGARDDIHNILPTLAHGSAKPRCLEIFPWRSLKWKHPISWDEITPVICHGMNLGLPPWKLYVNSPISLGSHLLMMGREIYHLPSMKLTARTCKIDGWEKKHTSLLRCHPFSDASFHSWKNRPFAPKGNELVFQPSHFQGAKMWVP